MMKSKVLIALAAAFVLAIPSMAVAQVPAEVPVQGFLTDDQGVPVDGSVSVEFTIYDAAVSGTELHTQTETVGADAGAFSVYLTPDLAIFENNTELFLGIAVDGEAEMSPRLKMGSVPYAAVAGNASTLEGMSASDFASSSYAPDWSEITGVPADIADGDDNTTTPNWSDVQNRPAGLDDGDDDTTYTASGAISIDGSNNITLNSSCTSGQVLKWDGSAWACAADEDANTTYSAAAGGGLSLNGTEFSIASGGVTNSHLNGAISPTKISGGAATLAGGADFNGDVSATGFSYDTPQTGRVFVVASQFNQSRNQETTSSFVSLSGYIYADNSGDSNYRLDLDAPVHLPQGATVTEFNCRAYDNVSGTVDDDDLAWDFDLKRLDITSTGPSTRTMATSEETDTSFDSLDYYDAPDTTIAYATVDNSQYAYYVTGHFTPDKALSNLRFYGCYVDYEVTDIQP